MELTSVAAKTSRSKFMIAYGILFLLAAIALYASIDMKRSDVYRVNWPTVIGKVISAELKSGGAGHNSSGQLGGSRWYFDIKYSYTVDGVEYTSTRATNRTSALTASNPSNESDPPQWLQDVIDKYPPNSEAVIHYSPKLTSYSYLYFEAYGAIIWWARITSLVLFLMGVLVVRMSIKGT